MALFGCLNRWNDTMATTLEQRAVEVASARSAPWAGRRASAAGKGWAIPPVLQWSIRCAAPRTAATGVTTS
jgi:hypothetical protein